MMTFSDAGRLTVWGSHTHMGIGHVNISIETEMLIWASEVATLMWASEDSHVQISTWDSHAHMGV